MEALVLVEECVVKETLQRAIGIRDSDINSP